MKTSKTLTITASLAALLLGNAAIDGNFVSQILPGQAANAGWIGDIIDRLPTPSGIYLNLNGQKYYFGDYAPGGDSAVLFKDGTWEVKVNGTVVAHGYGRHPAWVVKAVTTFFGPVPVY
jgi:hypothetical protein